MAGKLYLCATPIGNLEDITMRVLRMLQEVDLIAAEDTRNSMKLLNHFEIKTPMTSYHEYNRIEKAHVLIAKMQEGTNIALITDAGTPGISDPGEDLVRLCYEAGIEVTSLPGACACVTALTLSGLGTRRFCFEAFLPMEKKERQEILNELKEQACENAGRASGGPWEPQADHLPGTDEKARDGLSDNAGGGPGVLSGAGAQRRMRAGAGGKEPGAGAFRAAAVLGIHQH